MPRGRWKRSPSLAWVGVGQRVEAKDYKDHWWPAKVTEVETADNSTSVKVTFDGWDHRFDEWLDDAAWVRKPIGLARVPARAGGPRVCGCQQKTGQNPLQ